MKECCEGLCALATAWTIGATVLGIGMDPGVRLASALIGAAVLAASALGWRYLDKHGRSGDGDASARRHDRGHLPRQGRSQGHRRRGRAGEGETGRSGRATGPDTARSGSAGDTPGKMALADATINGFQ